MRVVTTMWKSTASVEVSQEPGTLILRLRGELDGASRDLIQPAVMAAIPSAYAVVLDLRDLTFCDSSGVAMFVAAQEMADAQATTLSIVNADARLARAFELSGIRKLLPISE